MIDLLLSIEAQYVSWINCSIILLSSSILFYQLARANYIKLSKKMAGIISLSLLLINIIITTTSLVPYYTRSTNNNKLYSSQHNNNYPHEKIYRNIYFFGGVAFVLVQIIIFYLILNDSFLQ
jgi:uncharacterized membrane protein YidH (DUF202 family)